MALCNQVGSILKQSISQHAASSMLNSIRYMSNRIFVGGITFGADDSALKDAFSGFGEVTGARVVVDRETGRSKGYGFVDYADEEDAQSAAEAMNGQEIDGRSITVRIAESRQPGPLPGRGGYGSNYGFGGGGGGRGGGGYSRNSSSGGGNDEV